MATEDQTQHDETPADDATRRDGERTQAQARETQPTAAEDAAELKAERDRLRRALEEANRKAKQDRLRLQEIDREREEKAARELPEVERLRKDRKALEDEKRAEADRAAALERENLALRVAHMVEREAQKQGFQYPEDVPKLIDAGRIEVDADTGKIGGVKEAVKRLADDRPGLLAAPAGRGSPGAATPRRPGQNGNGQQAAPDVDIEHELRRAVRYGI